MLTRTILAAISEPILETITYLFIGFGAIALIGLITYAVVVFRRVSELIPEATKTLNAMSALLDAAVSSVNALEENARRERGGRCTTQSEPAPTITLPSPVAMCTCGGTFLPAGSTVGDGGARLTVKCSKCGCQHTVPLS